MTDPVTLYFIGYDYDYDYERRLPKLRTATRIGPGGGKRVVVQCAGDRHRMTLPADRVFDTPAAAWRHTLARLDGDVAARQDALDEAVARVAVVHRALEALGERVV